MKIKSNKENNFYRINRRKYKEEDNYIGID